MRLKNTLVKLTLAPVLLMALLAGACSDQAAPSQELVGPQQAVLAKGNNKGHSRKLRLTNPAPLQVVADVGPEGALLRADNYFLYVPENAVNEITTFTMNVGTDGLAQLTATADRGEGVREDVGVLGFQRPLTLALYYGNSSEGIANANNLSIAWVQDNGSLQPVLSQVNTNYKVVYGELSHFSAYAIIIPE
jgi:hypothetical protein